MAFVCCICVVLNHVSKNGKITINFHKIRLFNNTLHHSFFENLIYNFCVYPLFLITIYITNAILELINKIFEIEKNL